MDREQKNKDTKSGILPVAVIGGGSAGTMAVMRTVLNNDRCLFFPGAKKHKKKSRAFWVTRVENMPDYHHYKKGIEQPNRNTIQWLKQCPLKDNLVIKENRGIDKLEKLPGGEFKLTDDEGTVYKTRYVILCTGIMDIQPLINGEIRPILPYANVQIVDYCIRCDGHHAFKKEVTVIGHCPNSAKVAILLFERYGSRITLLPHNHDPKYDRDDLILLNSYGIKIQRGEIVEIIGNPKEKKLEGYKLADGTPVKTDFSFVSLGMIVYNDLAKSLDAKIDERGFVITDKNGQSSVDGLYIAGDLRANAKKQIYTAWDHAVDCADAINRKIRMARRP